MHTPERYGRVAQAFHWLSALLILSALGLGLSLSSMPLSPQKIQFINWHKWIGATVLLLVALRLLWRVWHPAPPLADAMPDWQHKVAGATHGLLYALMLAMPLSGWMMSSAKGYPLVYLGMVQIPDLLGKNKELGESLAGVHQALAWTLIALMVLHVGAALKHHFIDRDTVLLRMLPHFFGKRG